MGPPTDSDAADPRGRDVKPRLGRPVYWAEWTLPRVWFALGWFVLTTLAGLFIFFVAGYESATVGGELPTTEELKTSAGLTLFAALLLGAGPFGIGVMRRSRGPKIAGAGLFLPTGAAAVYYLVKSF